MVTEEKQKHFTTNKSKLNTYIKTRTGCDGDLGNFPNISTIARPCPRWIANISSCFDVNIQLSNVLAIHVVPELETLVSLPSRIRWTYKPCFVSLFPRIRCLNVHIEPFKISTTNQFTRKTLNIMILQNSPQKIVHWLAKNHVSITQRKHRTSMSLLT